MNEEISFSEGEKKVTPEIMDSEIQEMRNKAIKGIEQQQIKQQEAIKAGVQPPLTEAEGIPKELPFLFFHYGAKALQCPAFQTDDAENKILAHHLSVIFGAWIKHVWVWSLIAIFIIIVGKLVQCWSAIKRFFKREKQSELPEKQTDMKITETL